jgi:hypothetical protein
MARLPRKVSQVVGMALMREPGLVQRFFLDGACHHAAGLAGHHQPGCFRDPADDRRGMSG